MIVPFFPPSEFPERKGWNGMGHWKCAVVMAGLALSAATPVRAQPEVRARLGAYLQVETQWSSLGTREDGNITTDLHRVRPRVDFEVGEWISGRIEPDFAGGRVRLRSAYIAFDLGGAELTFGQFKKPFGLIQLTSSSAIPVIERPTAIAGLNDRFDGLPLVELPDGRSIVPDEQTILDLQAFQGYAVGAAVGGDAGRLSWQAGIFEGPVESTALGRSGVAGRATFAVVPDVRVGAGVSHSRLRFEDEERDGTAGSVEVAVGQPARPGFGVLSEGVFGSGAGTGTNFAGAHAIVWWHGATSGRITGVEPLARVSWGDPDTDGEEDAGMLFTAGVNLYMGGLNRLMLNWDVYRSSFDSIGTESALRVQAQVRF